jgi:hypothetical protein
MAEFEVVFGDSEKARTSANKLRRLQQRTHSAIVYALEFKQLAYDVNWGKVALIDQFCYGLRDDVQDLLLTLVDPSYFSEPSPRQFDAIIVFSNVARKRKSSPTPNFGTVGLLRFP